MIMLILNQYVQLELNVDYKKTYYKKFKFHLLF